MPAAKTDIFSEQHNAVAQLAKALAHPARVAILQHLLSVDGCVCGTLVDKIGVDRIGFALPDGSLMPCHFHVTEVGKITKEFIDCGGTVRQESVVNFQLYSADDYDHRLHPEKLLHIIELSERKLGLDDIDIEVEYQGDTIGNFGLEFGGEHFALTTKQTDCLAKDKCGIPQAVALPIASNQAACKPDGGCC